MTNQRGFAVLLLVYVLTALAAVGATWAFLEKRCNSACKDARAEIVILQEQKAQAQKRAADMAMLASQRLAALDGAVRANQEKNDATIADLEKRARALRTRLVRVSADLDRVLNDAAVAANGGSTTAPAVDQGTAAAVPPAPSTSASLVTYDERDLAAWGVKAAAAYLSAVTKWRACVAAYESVRAVANAPPQ